MRGIFGLLSPRKASSHSTVLPSLFSFRRAFFFPRSIPPAVRPTLFTTDGFGIFNVRTNLGACRTHEGGSGWNKSAEELTPRDTEKLWLESSCGGGCCCWWWWCWCCCCWWWCFFMCHKNYMSTSRCMHACMCMCSCVRAYGVCVCVCVVGVRAKERGIRVKKTSIMNANYFIS